MREAVIVSYARTGLAKSGRGGFNITPPMSMAAHAIKHAVERAGVDKEYVEDCYLGNCAHGAPNIGRQAALLAGLPKTIHITSQEIRESLADTIGAIVDAVRTTLERCPPELSADLVDRGFVMAGGGSLIRGIDRLLSNKTGLPVTIADDPLSAVANGTGAVLNDLSWLMQNA